MDKPEKFENNAKTLLDESAESLNPDITRRLRQARYAALEKAHKPAVWGGFPQAVTAMLAIAVVSISLIFTVDHDSSYEIVNVMEDEIEMLTSTDNMELMEDLEFMQWLVETERYAS